MLKTIDNFRLVRFEPEAHATWLYHWYYSGLYEEFFREWPVCPSLGELAQAAVGKTFMVISPEEKVVGLAMFFNLSEHARHVEIGLLIDKAFEAKGIGIKAFKILSYYLFNTCNLFLVEMKVMSRNRRLEKILKALGVTREAPLRKRVYLGGDFHELTVWSMTKGEFNKLYQKEIEGLTRGATDPVISEGDLNGQERSVPIQTLSRPAVRTAGAVG